MKPDALRKTPKRRMPMNRFVAYERAKAALPPMSPQQYEAAVRELAQRYKV